MTPRDFVYWLQGVFEVTNPETLTADQIKVIRDHIGLVLKRETQPLIQATSGYVQTPLSGLTATC